MKTLFFAVIASMLLIGCSPGDKASDPQPTAVSVVQIEAYQAPVAIYTATLAPRFQTPLAFRVAGRIDQRHVEAGDNIAQGQSLATLDPADFEQQLSAAKAAFVAAERNLEKAANDLRRGQTLFNTGAIGDDQLERYQVTLASARGQQQQARSQLKQAENALGYTELKAPMAGTVVAVDAQPGLVVNAGQAVIQLAQGDQLQITIDLPEQVSAPKTAELVLNDNIHDLTLFSVSGALDPQSFTRRARYNLSTQPQHFSFGQLAQARLPVAGSISQASALTVPISAIDERGKQPRVWVIRDNKAAVIPISVLEVGTQTAMIMSDQLSAGAKVIAYGINRLSEGQTVRAVN